MPSKKKKTTAEAQKITREDCARTVLKAVHEYVWDGDSSFKGDLGALQSIIEDDLGIDEITEDTAVPPIIKELDGLLRALRWLYPAHGSKEWRARRA